MSNTSIIYNGTIITPYRLIPNGTLVFKDGIITDVVPGTLEIEAGLAIDAKGQYVAPGFIDMHVHGGGGYDFMDGTETAFLQVAETHARFGTTAMLPTTLASTKEQLLNILAVYDRARRSNTSGAQFLGVHLEGPYFSMSQRGAQDPRYIRDPNPGEYRQILNSSDHIRRWSAAPELKGALEFSRCLQSKGILVSLAHTDAVYEEVIVAFENGYTLATHLYSAMSGVTRRNAYRYAGTIESAFLIDEMDVEIIADGVHLPAPLLKLVYEMKGPGRTALITDAMRGAAMPEGESVLGNITDGLKVIVENGVAKLPDRSAFAGSVATANRLIRTMVSEAGIPLVDAVRMMTSTPARILNVSDKKGTLAADKDADIVIFDNDINIQMTLIKGQIVYRTSSPLIN